jgi:hypothetical protein
MRPEIEKRARELANAATLLGPQTVPEIIAEHERKLEQDNRLIAESRAQFKRGEIIEEELYDGDFLIQRGLYPILLEARLFGKVHATYIGVTVDTLRENPEVLETIWVPRVREMLAERIAEALSEKSKAEGVSA